jgi:hypothetical protein
MTEVTGTEPKITMRQRGRKFVAPDSVRGHKDLVSVDGRPALAHEEIKAGLLGLCRLFRLATSADQVA